MTDAPNTETLWTATHSALCAGRFSEARRLLDDLGRRHDVRDLLSDASAYGVPAQLRAVIQDRIDLVNARVA